MMSDLIDASLLRTGAESGHEARDAFVKLSDASLLEATFRAVILPAAEELLGLVLPSRALNALLLRSTVPDPGELLGRRLI